MNLPKSTQAQVVALFLELLLPIEQRLARKKPRPVWKWYRGSRGHVVAELGGFMLDRRKGDSHAYLFRLEGGEWEFQHAVHVQTDLQECVSDITDEVALSLRVGL